MTLYDNSCVEIFIGELCHYIKNGGDPPMIPPLDDIDLMDELGEIAGAVVSANMRDN